MLIGSGCWRVHRVDLDRCGAVPPEIAAIGGPASLRVWAQQLGVGHGEYFLLGPRGFPDVRVNSFLRSAKFKLLAATTQLAYVHSLALWLNFLETRGCPWWQADDEHTEDFEFYPAKPQSPTWTPADDDAHRQ